MSYCSTEAWICSVRVSVISTQADDMYQRLFRKEPAIFYFASVCLSHTPVIAEFAMATMVQLQVC